MGGVASDGQEARRTTADRIGRLGRRIRGARRRATTVALAPWVRAVAAGRWRGARPGRRYWTDCYRRASDYVLAQAPPPAAARPGGAGTRGGGVRLVHGVCRDDRVQWAHAWVELAGGLVFDGVRQQFYDRDGYYRVLRATPEATYTAAAMRARMAAAGHYGPWHEGALGRESVRRLGSPARMARAGAHGAGAAA